MDPSEQPAMTSAGSTFLKALEHVLLHPRQPRDIDLTTNRQLRLVDCAAREVMTQHIISLSFGWEARQTRCLQTWRLQPVFQQEHAGLVAKAPRLRQLSLARVALLPEWAFTLTLAGATTLRELRLYEVDGLQRDELFEALAALPSLEALELCSMDLAVPTEASAAGVLCLTGLTALTRLSMSYTRMPGFEEAIGQLTALRSLHLDIQFLNVREDVLGSSVAALGRLEILDWHAHTPEGLMAVLRGSTAPLRVLRACLNNSSGDDGAAGIPELLVDMPRACLDTLKLSCEYVIVMAHWRSVVQLGTLTQLTDLDLSFRSHKCYERPMTDAEWAVASDVAASLGRLTALRQLSLGGILGMDHEEEAVWLGMLSGMTALQTLVLWVHDEKRGYGRDEEAGVVCEELAARLSASRAPLQELSMSDSMMGPAGMEALARPLLSLVGNTLTKLDVFGAGLGLEGCVHLARVLAHHAARLCQLELGRNDIWPDGMKALAPALRCMVQLRGLGLAVNQLNSLGAGLLADCIRGLPELRVVLVGANQLGSLAIELMCRSVQGNALLETLDLSCNGVCFSPDEPEALRLSSLANVPNVILHHDQYLRELKDA